MLMTWIWCGLVLCAIGAAMYNGTGAELSAAVATGAQAGVQLAISMAGAICLWSGVGRLLEKIGATAWLSKLLRPVLHRVFPSTRENPALAGHLSGNICANLLGLGNAATPMGIRAARELEHSLHTTDSRKCGGGAGGSGVPVPFRHPSSGMGNQPLLRRAGALRRLGAGEGLET